MTLSLDEVFDDVAALASRQGGAKAVEKKDVKAIWNAVTQLVKRQFAAGSNVEVAQFGKFLHANSAPSEAGKQVGAFVMMKRYCDHYGLKAKSGFRLESGSTICEAKANDFTITNELSPQYTKDVVSFVLKEILRQIGEAMATGESVTVDFGAAKIIVGGREVSYHFKGDKVVSQQYLDQSRSSSDLRGSARSRRSGSPTSICTCSECLNCPTCKEMSQKGGSSVASGSNASYRSGRSHHSHRRLRHRSHSGSRERSSHHSGSRSHRSCSRDRKSERPLAMSVNGSGAMTERTHSTRYSRFPSPRSVLPKGVYQGLMNDTNRRIHEAKLNNDEIHIKAIAKHEQSETQGKAEDLAFEEAYTRIQEHLDNRWHELRRQQLLAEEMRLRAQLESRKKRADIREQAVKNKLYLQMQMKQNEKRRKEEAEARYDRSGQEGATAITNVGKVEDKDVAKQRKENLRHVLDDQVKGKKDRKEEERLKVLELEKNMLENQALGETQREVLEKEYKQKRANELREVWKKQQELKERALKGREDKLELPMFPSLHGR